MLLIHSEAKTCAECPQGHGRWGRWAGRTWWNEFGVRSWMDIWMIYICIYIHMYTVNVCICIYRAAIRTPSNFKMFQKHQKQLVLPSSDNLTCSTRPGRNWCNDDCVWLDEGRCVPGDEEVRYEDRCMDASTRGGTAFRANHQCQTRLDMYLHWARSISSKKGPDITQNMPEML